MWRLMPRSTAQIQEKLREQLQVKVLFAVQSLWEFKATVSPQQLLTVCFCTGGSIRLWLEFWNFSSFKNPQWISFKFLCSLQSRNNRKREGRWRAHWAFGKHQSNQRCRPWLIDYVFRALCFLRAQWLLWNTSSWMWSNSYEQQHK